MVGSAEDLDAAIITSAALPWRTGPSVFSIWHACGLAERGLRVVYVIPWLEARSQVRAWGAPVFETPQDQTDWLQAEAMRLTGLPLPRVVYYRGRFSRRAGSVIPLQDVYAMAPAARAWVLHEPEHLSWFPFSRKRARIPAATTVGLTMTNYEFYVAASGLPFAHALASRVARFHLKATRERVDVPVRISPAMPMPGLPANDTRITGVGADYAEVPPVAADVRGIYFIGKLIWEKGLARLIETSARTGLAMDLYGGGEHEQAIRAKAKAAGAPLRFMGPHDSPWKMLDAYRVFFNPSESEGLCTTTAEALVAGRNVVLPDCSGNLPFLGYPNTYFYKPGADPTPALTAALETQPAVPDHARRDFDWRVACDALISLCNLQHRASVTPRAGHRGH